MTSLPIYLGYKYFRSKKGAFASFTSLMAIAGLSLGVAALVIVLSVMNGFEKELQTRVLGVVPQLIIRSNDGIDDYQELVHEAITQLDKLNISRGGEVRYEELVETFRSATVLEADFWQMGLNASR